jgi:poly-gamma-glutamate capsule biosynthesis protein CapA/YwtB (metallophosphatase superfamily)
MKCAENFQATNLLDGSCGCGCLFDSSAVGSCDDQKDRLHPSANHGRFRITHIVVADIMQLHAIETDDLRLLMNEIPWALRKECHLPTVFVWKTDEMNDDIVIGLPHNGYEYREQGHFSFV